VTVEVTEYHLMDVMVLGDVARPSTVELRRDRMSVLHALLAAGGPVEFEGRVTIIPAHDPDDPVRFDLGDAPELAQAAKAGVLKDGDVMIVDRRPQSAVFVLGLVNLPGPVPMPRATSLSVLQALGSAGGTRLEFQPKDATVLRRNPDGTVLRVRLDLQRTMNGDDPDIRLAAGDILLVPHNADTRIEEFIARNLRMGFGLDATFNPWGYYYFREDQKLREDFGVSGSYLNTAAPSTP
jgi:protein involved in polysaccharide export with SLBB domain